MSVPRPRRLTHERARLERAKARLDTLRLYPRPVSLRGVRVLVWPAFFRLPRLRRYSGYAFTRTIVVRHDRASDRLLTHELCHVWQMQHRPVRVVLAWLLTPYDENPFELEARRAAATAP